MELQVRLGRMTGDVEKDVKTLSSFVFQQSEELRYLLNNLDVTNFNDLGLMRYENGRLQIYTEAINIKAKELKAEFESADKELKTTIEADVNGLRTEVSGLDGRVSTVEQTANGLKSTVNGLDGRVSTVEQTANGLKTTVNGLDGRVSTVEQTANGLKTTVSGLDGRISTVEQTANGLKSTVSGLDGRISTVEQTANGLKSTVSGHTTSIGNLQSQITQNTDSISLVVSNGSIKAASIVTAINNAGSSVKISADHVNISGLVKISDLEGNGTVEINAGNIAAGGTISGVGFVSESTDWGGERYVEIVNGTIYLGNGSIYGGADFGISIGTNGELWLNGDMVYIVSDDSTWRLTSTGLEKWV